MKAGFPGVVGLAFFCVGSWDTDGSCVSIGVCIVGLASTALIAVMKNVSSHACLFPRQGPLDPKYPAKTHVAAVVRPAAHPSTSVGIPFPSRARAEPTHSPTTASCLGLSTHLSQRVVYAGHAKRLLILYNVVHFSHSLHLKTPDHLTIPFLESNKSPEHERVRKRTPF